MKLGSMMMHARTVALMAAFVAAPVAAHAQTPAATPAPAAGLPEAKVLMAQFNEALGGKDALTKLQSIHMTGTMNMGGMVAEFESFSARPNKTVTIVSVQGMQMKQGFDGETGWSVNPVQGATVLDGDMLAAAKDGADFDSMMRDPAKYKSVETVGKVTLDGRECYRVKVVTMKDVESFDCYATDTHLLVGTTATSPEIGETSSFLRDYKQFGGVMFPTKMVMTAAMGQQEMTLNLIETNNVDASKFALPDEIKALIKK